jgi:hypothetical protein
MMPKEMRTATQVVISAGPWNVHAGALGIELMFDDETPAPFAIF